MDRHTKLSTLQDLAKQLEALGANCNLVDDALVSSITKTARNSDCCYAGSDLIDLLEFACHAWSNAEPIDSPAG